MAALSSRTLAIEKLEAAKDGSEMRQALIDLIDTLNTIPAGGDTDKLGGQGPSYYVTFEELENISKWINKQILVFEATPKENSFKVINNENLSNRFYKILIRLRQINGNYRDEWVAQTGERPIPMSEIGEDIKEALVLLKGSLDYIEQSISNKGVDIPATDSAAELPKHLADIGKDEYPVEVVPYTATKNDFEMEYEEGKAYNPVTVAVQLKGYQVVADKNGSYEVPEGYDGFSSVDVQVPDEGGSYSGGYSGGGGGGSGSSNSKSADEEFVYNTGPTTITDNGTYVASDYGIEGFDEIEVNVTNYEIASDKTFKVTFVVEGVEVDVQENIAPGSSVTYKGDPSALTKGDDSEFWYFSGWQPTPNKVVSDMVCNAVFTNWNPNSAFPTAQQYRYIQDSWEDICAKPDQYNPGDVKLLKTSNGIVTRVMKVSSENEDGALSAWISMDSFQLPEPLTTTYTGDPTQEGPGQVYCGWESCSARTYLNTTFFRTLPQALQSKIKPVHKVRSVFNVSDSNGNGYKLPSNWKSTHRADATVRGLCFEPMSDTDSIWIPGMHELRIVDEKDTGDVCDVATASAYGVYYPVDLRIPPIYTGIGMQYSTYGKMYKRAFLHYGKEGTYRGQVTPLYQASTYNVITEFEAIRHLLPHLKTPFEIDGVRYTDWDALDIMTQHAHLDVEPNLNNYQIQYAKQGMMPSIYYSGNYTGYGYGDYNSIQAPVMLRDLRMGSSTGVHNYIEFMGLDRYGYPSISIRTNTQPQIIFGFCL